jgi:hypothetical protein
MWRKRIVRGWYPADLGFQRPRPNVLIEKLTFQVLFWIPAMGTEDLDDRIEAAEQRVSFPVPWSFFLCLNSFCVWLLDYFCLRCAGASVKQTLWTMATTAGKRRLSCCAAAELLLLYHVNLVSCLEMHSWGLVTIFGWFVPAPCQQVTALLQQVDDNIMRAHDSASKLVADVREFAVHAK